MTQGVDPRVLRGKLDELGVDLNAGSVAGYVTADADLNLNAFAIGLGLENVTYEPDRFPGLCYHPRGSQATVAFFENGVIAAVDGADGQAVEEALTAAVERGEELGLVAVDPASSMTVDVDAIPVADELGGATER